MSSEVWTSTASHSISKAEWRGWEFKGYLNTQKYRAGRIKVVKCISISILLVAALLLSQSPPYEVAIRFTLTACAMSAMFESFQSRRYVLAALLGTLALLYNPIAQLSIFQTMSGTPLW